jgi:guanine deaminase
MPLVATAAGSLAVRGHLLHCLDDPFRSGAGTLRSLPDGVMIVENGHIAAIGAYAELAAAYAASPQRIHRPGMIIMPGFVDTHVHAVQTDVIASPGRSLLDWLERFTFPAEQRFADGNVCDEVAAFFLHELLRNGTTTASVFASVHPGSCDAVFAHAYALGMRINCGKVLMDRHVPDAVRDTAVEGLQQCADLIERWHGRGRLRFSITPRFAPTSSRAQLEGAAELFAMRPDLHLQSHLAENQDEVRWVSELYPEARSYLDVYDRFGLLGPRAIYAHGIWLDHEDRLRMAQTGTSIAFCPTSNLFLGSGLFDLRASCDAGVAVGLGTDVGGGTSFSMLRTMAEAYKVSQLRGYTPGAGECLYLGTLGAAKALGLDHYIGNFEIGKEADFVVCNLQATPLMARRIALAASAEEQLFVLMTLGDDRAIAETYVSGVRRYAGADLAA